MQARRWFSGGVQQPSDLAEVATPLALTAERVGRALSADDAKDTFDSSLLLAEATLKWAVTTGVSLLRDHEPRRADVIAATVIRGDSAGAWATAIRACVRRLPRARSAEIRQWTAAFVEKHRAGDPPEGDVGVAYASLRRIIEGLGESDYAGLERRRHSLLDLLDDFVFIRNRTRGHGAQLPDFFARHAADAATAALALVRSVPRNIVWWERHVGDEGDSGLLATALVGLEPVDAASAAVAGFRGDAHLVVATTERALPLEGVVEVRSDPLAFLFANGRWNDTSAICQFLDYATGRTDFRERAVYGGAALLLPASETSPPQTLMWEEHCAHNLPEAPASYVRRPALEERLRSIITDDRHRIVSLRGGGGMGKTALALRVLRDLVSGPEDFGFDAVLWFSARDIDLLEGGPGERRRDVTDIGSVAESFAALLEVAEPTAEATVDFLISELSSTEDRPTRYLIVLDNMETFDDPAAVLRLLDDEVRLPSKVLVTTRHEDFLGDYPVPVAGMEANEAHELLLTEGRRHYCEPRLTDSVRETLIRVTDARAYALKLAVAQIAKGIDPQEVARRPERADVLAALFDRSFERLSDDGRFLYLLLGALGRGAAEVPLHAILTSHGRNFEGAAEELTAMSLSERERSRGFAAFRLLQMAQRHAAQSLRGDADEIEINEAARQLRAWLTPSGGGTAVGAFLRNVLLQARESSGDAERVEQLIAIAESAAEAQPELWLELAAQLEELGFDPARTREAYKRAAEVAELDDTRVWRAWADFEERQGDDEQALYKAIRAVEADSSDVAHCSRVAAQLVAYVSANREAIPHSRRSFLVSSVRRALEDHRDAGALNATDLSRLGWLYLIEFARGTNPDFDLVRAARRAARDGLAIDADNRYCARLLERTEDELRSGRQNLPGG